MITQIDDRLHRLINKHRLFSIALVIFILALKPRSISSEIHSKLIYDTNSIKGDWRDTVFLNRNVKLADKVGQKANLKIKVPKDGYYKIYLHLYYKWEKTCPKIDFVIINADKRFTGSLALETNRIAPEMDGRWVFKTLETSKPLYLNSGEAETTLSLKSIASYWQQDLELNNSDGIVAIDYLFLQPVIFKEGKIISLDIIETESFKGNWHIKNFDKLEKTGIIKTTSKSSSAFRTIYMPYSGSFKIYISAKADFKNYGENKRFLNMFRKIIFRDEKIKIEITNDELRFSKKISLNKDNKNWQLIYVGDTYLKKGEHRFEICGQDNLTNQINIDFFILLPNI